MYQIQFIYESEIINTNSNYLRIFLISNDNSKFIIKFQRPRFGKLTHARLFILHTKPMAFIPTPCYFPSFYNELMKVVTSEEIKNMFECDMVSPLNPDYECPIKPSGATINLFGVHCFGSDADVGYHSIFVYIFFMLSACAFEFNSTVREWLLDFDIST